MSRYQLPVRLMGSDKRSFARKPLISGDTAFVGPASMRALEGTLTYGEECYRALALGLVKRHSR